MHPVFQFVSQMTIELIGKGTTPPQLHPLPPPIPTEAQATLITAQLYNSRTHIQ